MKPIHIVIRNRSRARATPGRVCVQFVEETGVTGGTVDVTRGHLVHSGGSRDNDHFEEYPANKPKMSIMMVVSCICSRLSHLVVDRIRHAYDPICFHRGLRVSGRAERPRLKLQPDRADKKPMHHRRINQLNV
jgi:hypothetical protein